MTANDWILPWFMFVKAKFRCPEQGKVQMSSNTQ